MEKFVVKNIFINSEKSDLEKIINEKVSKIINNMGIDN